MAAPRSKRQAPPGRTGDELKWPWWLTALLLVAAAAVLAWRLDLVGRLRPVRGPEPPTVRIGPHAFAVELPRTEEAIKRGLAFRSEVPPGRGMLFIYPAPLQPDEMSFWMKDCLIDLDIAFLSADRRIVTIHTMKAEPPGTPDSSLRDYHPGERAQFALEAGAGEFARLGVKVGDRVEFDSRVEQAVRDARE